MRQRLDNAPGWVKYIVNALVEGTIGNIGYAVFLGALAIVVALYLLLRLYLVWAFVAILLIGIFALLNFIRQQDGVISQTETRLTEVEADRRHAANTVKLDDRLFPLLLTLMEASPEERDRTLEILLTELLRALTEAVEGVSRGTLLRREGDYLVPWIPYEMPQNHLSGIRFYVGNDHSRYGERGVAGIAYETRLLQTVHVSQEGGLWRSDHPAYTPPADPTRRPPYLSFVAIPLIGQLEAGQTDDPVGVLCLDSMNPTAFDAPEAEKTLLVLGDRLLIAIAIHAKLRQLRP